MIETALGPVERDALGVVSMHEHLRADASALHRPGVEELDADAPVCIELAGALRWGQLALRDNLRIDDDDAVAQELAAAHARGLRTVVDATSLGLNPGYEHLAAISRASGVTVVACYGAYLGSGIPSWYRDLDTAGREQVFLTALTDSIPGVEFRAGMLGIMGTTADFGADERSSLTAAASAAARAGASVSIRLDPDARNGLEIIDHCASAGLAPERIVLTNIDEYLDDAYLNDLVDAGPVLEMCFGGEGGHLGRVRNSADFDRFDALLRLLARDDSARLVLGCSTWTKAQWSRFGGPGYGHLVTRVVPALRSSGVDDSTLDRMLIHEPARILDRTAAA
ncbi:phosphotriesterase [Homoserinimonas hongtaonis]|uniref:Phosphotriesterase n=1 Tax=Homoserinimonas hongtaonis TaxID=2079791 RepID=A0A2U1SWU0_9MICO|nr:phosphotriesterase [Salinibacterium hongtaonis]PWB96013.1 phosphotriesterase [Salinibacterium hongtaonis]